MARVNYYGIEQAIRAQLLADAGLIAISARAEIESAVQFAAEMGPVVFIYLDRRSAPADAQRLRAGQSTDFELTFSLWCFTFGLEVAAATQGRDDLMGLVELALMADRTLGATVITCWLDGGEFLTIENNGFISGGEVIVTATVRATT